MTTANCCHAVTQQVVTCLQCCSNSLNRIISTTQANENVAKINQYKKKKIYHPPLDVFFLNLVIFFKENLHRARTSDVTRRHSTQKEVIDTSSFDILFVFSVIDKLNSLPCHRFTRVYHEV